MDVLRVYFVSKRAHIARLCVNAKPTPKERLLLFLKIVVFFIHRPVANVGVLWYTTQKLGQCEKFSRFSHILLLWKNYSIKIGLEILTK